MKIKVTYEKSIPFLLISCTFSQHKHKTNFQLLNKTSFPLFCMSSHIYSRKCTVLISTRKVICFCLNAKCPNSVSVQVWNNPIQIKWKRFSPLVLIHMHFCSIGILTLASLLTQQKIFLINLIRLNMLK